MNICSYCEQSTETNLINNQWFCDNCCVKAFGKQSLNFKDWQFDPPPNARQREKIRLKKREKREVKKLKQQLQESKTKLLNAEKRQPAVRQEPQRDIQLETLAVLQQMKEEQITSGKVAKVGIFGMAFAGLTGWWNA